MSEPIFVELLNIDGSTIAFGSLKWTTTGRDQVMQAALDETLGPVDTSFELPGRDPRCPYVLTVRRG